MDRQDLLGKDLFPALIIEGYVGVWGVPEKCLGVREIHDNQGVLSRTHSRPGFVC
jgi:hypothetical protein